MVESFTDTAAIFALTKYIITIDSATLHLAGAMGLPCCGLIPSTPDWRWMLERSDTPWYPKHRLFRQKQKEDWVGVFKEMKEELMLLTSEENKVS